MSASRIEMMGCQIDNPSMEETLQTIEGFIDSGKPHQHMVMNADKLVKAQHNPELRRIINECALINADGMPVVWASRLLGKPLKERVAGVDLCDALLRRAADKGWRVFLLGAKGKVPPASARPPAARSSLRRAPGPCANHFWRWPSLANGVAVRALNVFPQPRQL